MRARAISASKPGMPVSKKRKISPSASDLASYTLGAALYIWLIVLGLTR